MPTSNATVAKAIAQIINTNRTQRPNGSTGGAWPAPDCTHIKANGLPCKAVAMSGSRYCYFHSRSRQRKRATQIIFDALRSEIANHPSQIPQSKQWDDFSAKLADALDLPEVEDSASALVFYNYLLHATARQQLSERRAAVLHRMLRGCFAVLKEYKRENWRIEERLETTVDADSEPLSDP